MRTYIGSRTAAGCTVLVEDASGELTPLDPRHDLRNHSPTGFEWGYNGSGPAQLALAIVADHMRAAPRTPPTEPPVPAPGPEEVADDPRDTFALRVYQAFKRGRVAGLPAEGWRLTADEVDDTLAEIIDGAHLRGTPEEAAEVRKELEALTLTIAKIAKGQIPGDVGFVVLLAPFGTHGATAYVSNGHRGDMYRMLLETCANFRRQGFEAAVEGDVEDVADVLTGMAGINFGGGEGRAVSLRLAAAAIELGASPGLARTLRADAQEAAASAAREVANDAAPLSDSPPD